MTCSEILQDFLRHMDMSQQFAAKFSHEFGRNKPSFAHQFVLLVLFFYFNPYILKTNSKTRYFIRLVISVIT